MLWPAKEKKMTKLTDTQLIVLSTAATRDDGAAVVPKGMKAAATKVGSSLVGRKLMRELRSKPGMPIWREYEDGRDISLIITRAGRDAIDISDHGGTDTRSAPKGNNPKLADVERLLRRGTPRPGSKQALVVSMLSKEKGVTLAALVEATGWLPHTTRAAMTDLRKRGFAVERTHDKTNGSFYRIVGEPKALVAA
jgi:hypothetical protein